MSNGNLEDLKELQSLLGSEIFVSDDPEATLRREVALNRAYDLASNLSYTYAKDAYELWEKHRPGAENVPSILKEAYDRLTPEQKSEKVSALEKAALGEARDDNKHRIIGRVLDRLEEKFPHAAKVPDIEVELSSGAFYREIVNLFEDRDFPDGAKAEELPSLEEILELTQFLDRHNDPVQRAELEKSALLYAQKVTPELNAEQMDFGNAVEVEDAAKVNFASLEELEEYLAPLAKDDRLIRLPNFEAVAYVDKETGNLTLAAKTPAEMKRIEALTLVGADGGEKQRQSANGNKMVFNAKDAEMAVPAMSIAMVRMKLNEKEIHQVQTAVREVTKPKPVDISTEAVKRAREMRERRLRERERTAAEHEPEPARSTLATQEAGSQSITRDDAFSFEKMAKLVPAHVERAYVKVPDKRGDKYFAQGKYEEPVFVDKGNKLETKSENEHTAEALVLIAEARGWETLKVSGSEAFRREVWLEATARGITVRGYKPTEIDKALLEKRVEKVGQQFGRNAIERVAASENTASAKVSEFKRGETPVADKAAAKDDAKAAKPAAKKLGESKDTAAKVFSGTLIEHGKAPFEFDKSNNENYFVRYKDDEGNERVTWGLDLERAMAEANPQPGDKITLQNEGRKPVEVDAKVKDDEGKVIGTKRITTHRNSWSVSVARDFLQMTAKDFAAKHPDQFRAAALNEFAKKVVAESPKFANMSEADKARFKDGMQQKIAEGIEKGQSLPTLKLVTKTKEREAVAEREPDRGRSR